MGAQGVMSHQLLSHLPGERRLQPASDVDRRQLLALAFVVGLQFRALKLEVGLFGIRLRVHRNVFTRRHGHSAGDQAGDPRDHYAAM